MPARRHVFEWATPGMDGNWTPLHRAVIENEQPKVLDVLIKGGARLATKDANGYTSLHWVAWNLQAKNV